MHMTEYSTHTQIQSQVQPTPTTPTTIKLELPDGSIRRRTLDNPSFQALSCWMTSFGSNFDGCTYQDDEGDTVCVLDEHDLQEALLITRQSNQKSLRLKAALLNPSKVLDVNEDEELAKVKNENCALKKTIASLNMLLDSTAAAAKATTTECSKTSSPLLGQSAPLNIKGNTASHNRVHCPISTNITKKSFEQVLDNFLLSEKSTFEFPCSLTSAERRSIHMIAAKRGLCHESYSTGQGRRLKIWKSNCLSHSQVMCTNLKNDRLVKSATAVTSATGRARAVLQTTTPICGSAATATSFSPFFAPTPPAGAAGRAAADADAAVSAASSFSLFSASTPPAGAAARWGDELGQIYGLGLGISFESDVLIGLLESHNGDVESVVGYLLGD